jgi:hypothetical protein
MISVVLYGRNDSHGYNLHKRAAISLNCVAELLTHPEDEIIYVDCNTPDDLPTFLEAIGDTLTPKLKSLLRILRIRPSLYDKFKGESPLKVLEPHSRNVAIRRSNPANRWILSTNTDMIFVVRDPKQSLSDAVTDLPDGFYELPRFEIPDSMWERFDRLNPSQVVSNMRRWGQSLHLNEAVSSHPVIRFDGPGDFQLMLRDQIFAIHGFDERMIWGWHADSNICKRMCLLNGRTDSFLDRCFGYHCSHVRTVTWYHSDNTTENSIDRFFRQVRTPYLPDQEDWGLVREELEELRLLDETGARFCQVLEGILPGTTEPFTSVPFTSESFSSGFYYDNEHVLPYLVEYLTTVHPRTVIGYFGGNMKMLSLLNEFLGKWAFTGSVLLCEDLLPPGESSISSLPESFKSIGGEDCIRQAEMLIFDFNMERFPKMLSPSGLSYPQISTDTEGWAKRLTDWFVIAAKEEHARALKQQRRKFLMVGWRHSSFESLYNHILESVRTPYASHVVYGYVRKNLDIENLEVVMKHSTFITKPTKEILDFVSRHLDASEPLLGPDHFMWLMPEQHHKYSEPIDWEKDYRWVIMFKDDVFSVSREVLSKIVSTMKPVYANECYVCFSSIPNMEPIRTSHSHYPFGGDALLIVLSNAGPNDPILASQSFAWESLAHQLHLHPCLGDLDLQKDYKFAVIDKTDFCRMNWRALLYLTQTMRPIKTDKQFVYFAKKGTGGASPQSIAASLHFGLLFAEAFLRKGVNHVSRRYIRHRMSD